jgi:hypothetical protein
MPELGVRQRIDSLHLFRLFLAYIFRELRFVFLAKFFREVGIALVAPISKNVMCEGLAFTPKRRRCRTIRERQRLGVGWCVHSRYWRASTEAFGILINYTII